ncbi:hypothetical protein EPN18_09720 [bacterium]|nr:MAG: hypothetical protein EPN18_09720 [bacterium]
MKFKCPKCGDEYGYAEAVKDDDLTAIIKMQADFAPHSKLVFEYVELFGATRPIKAAKLLRLLLDVRMIWTSGSFAYQKSRYIISLEGMAEALKTVCNKNLTALDSHNYLKKVMIGIAEGEANKKSVAAEKALKQREAQLRAGNRPEPEGQSKGMPEELRRKLNSTGAGR